MSTASVNRTHPVVEPDNLEESSSSDFDKRQERINRAGKVQHVHKFTKSWRGHEDSVLDKVRKTKEKAEVLSILPVPDSARNLLDTTDKIDSTRSVFHVDDGTQDAINIDNLKESAKLEQKKNADDIQKGEKLFDDCVNKLKTQNSSLVPNQAGPITDIAQASSTFYGGAKRKEE